MTTKDVHRLIPRIYDAALDEGLWSSALDAVAEASEARGAILFALDNMGLPFAIHESSSSYDPKVIAYYLENYAKYEEAAWQKLQNTPPRKFLLDTDIWPDIAARADRPDYKWMLANVGILRRGSARLNSLPGFSDSFSLQFPDSMPQVPRRLVDNAEFLAPHLAKAVELHRSFAILKSRFNAVLGALDHVSIGVCVTSGHGDVIVSNKEAQRILEMGNGLSLGRDKRFRCSDADMERAIALAVQEAIRTVKGSSGTHEALIAVRRRSGTVPLLLEIAPMSDSVGELDPSLRGSIVFIIDPLRPRPLSAAAISKAFGLSRTQTEVCRRMVEGRTDSEIAEERSVSVETIRSHMKSIYQKTNTRRRADLIRAALSVSPPIDLADGSLDVERKD